MERGGASKEQRGKAQDLEALEAHLARDFPLKLSRRYSRGCWTCPRYRLIVQCRLFSVPACALDLIVYVSCLISHACALLFCPNVL
ncbi:hypothetical protein OBBRIDRAFT_219096 [Obba rivulosa]|uniref:Uncharacterized protein n=1 Tax=Obba rivulosa TaxID=1052685 RepID=A0A8E2DG17_9APHY|nr:hypothetical protein OBBRIDRAFT_219096 [Obba rivulosa]